MLFLPELTILGAGLLFFLLTLGQPSSATVRTSAIIAAGAILCASLLSLSQEGELFYGVYRVDLFSQAFKTLIAAAALVVILFGNSLVGIKQDSRPEYYLFFFVSCLGLMMLVSSVELLAIFISLELSSFAVYIMVPMRQTESGVLFQMEAGIKYLLFGVMATGFMLFGMSYIFGLSGSTSLDVIARQLPSLAGKPAAVVAMLMIMAGFFYKLAIFPFHFWVPDVYEGAANETTAFIAAVPKLAAVALLVRLTALASPQGDVVINMLMICAILSMFYGNLSALVQKDIKRMLGYSGIAHAGFILLGLLTLKTSGYANSLYYITGYALMNLACFLVICQIAGTGQNVAIADFSGLHKRAPILALTLTVALFSLAGIPPFVGFTGKFMLLVGALQENHLLLVTLAAINTAIAIYYYLSVVRLAYCTDSTSQDTIETGILTNSLSLLLIMVIIVMGVSPSWFVNFAEQAIRTIP
ncbi:MAG: NADH-quinone oxidoreductase subunit N [Desulfobulbaceae bacterium]|nr:MAG: NADH-quinone oxidoreductase subunit N [Desulfobulbaceae bacterium]